MKKVATKKLERILIAKAEFDCKILAIETGDGQPVEFGSHLIKVEKV